MCGLRFSISCSRNGGSFGLTSSAPLFVLIPVCLLLSYLSWPLFFNSFQIGEMSGNAGGLLRWPVKFMLPAGFFLLALQGFSEVIKRMAALRGDMIIDAKYERPTQ